MAIKKNIFYIPRLNLIFYAKTYKVLIMFLCMLCAQMFLIATEVKLSLIDNGQGEEKSQTVFVGTPFSFEVSVIDGDRNGNAVEIEGLDKVKIVSTRQSTNVSIINGATLS